MRKLFCLFGLLSCAVSSSLASKWLYYEHYPWVYDHVSKDWWYLTSSSTGKIYKYQSSSGQWSEFGVITPQPIITIQGEKVVIDKIGNKYRYTDLEGIMTWTVSNIPSTSLMTNWQIHTNYHDHNRSWSIEGAFDDLPSENLSEINYEIDNLGNYIMKMPDLWGPLGYFWRTWEILSVENGIVTIDSIPSPSYGNSPTYLFFSKEKATEFHELKLHEQWILDPEPYGGLDVLQQIKDAMDSGATELHLHENNITDITPLAGLTNLTYLNLYKNNISDLTPLAGLTNLTELALHNNNISDISPLAGLTNLKRLWLHGNNIADITPLAGLKNISKLNLSSNEISDLAVLAEMTKLEELYLYKNKIFDLSPLAGLTNLTGLSLQENHLTASQKAMLEEALPDTTINWPDEIIDDRLWYLNYEEWILEPEPYGGSGVLQKIKDSIESGTTELYLHNKNISDLSPLEGLTYLTKLYLHNNSISDISPLEGLTNLMELNLGSNNISDITPLAGLTNLVDLYLWNNNISDITPLAGLTNLVDLYVDENNISNLTPLAGLTNLVVLALTQNSISDLTPLAGLTNLSWLYLYGNNISDLTPLTGLTNLNWLYLQSNNFTASQKAILKDALSNTNITW